MESIKFVLDRDPQERSFIRPSVKGAIPGRQLNWPREEVDKRLKTIMKNIHRMCKETAEQYGAPGNYVTGANIAGFVKVVDSMIDQGVV